MKAAVYYSNTDIRVEELPKPQINEDEMLVEMKACGICGSDVMEWYRIKSAPRVLGHEMTGDIVEMGEKVSNFRVGQRVFVSHHVPCNTCKICLSGHHTACKTLRTTNFYPGGFAEYIRVPSVNVERGTFVLPETISYQDGTFIEPLGCVVRAQRLCNIGPDRNVLVVGSGITGLLHIKLAVARGAGTVVATDVSSYKLSMAEKAGAESIDARGDVVSEVKNILPHGADVVFICTSAEKAFIQAMELVAVAGTLCVFAPPPPDTNIPVPLTEYWKKDITIKPTYAAAPRDIREAISLIEHKRVVVSDLITHSFPLEEAPKAFETMLKDENAIKVIIENR